MARLRRPRARRQWRPLAVLPRRGGRLPSRDYAVARRRHAHGHGGDLRRPPLRALLGTPLLLRHRRSDDLQLRHRTGRCGWAVRDGDRHWAGGSVAVALAAEDSAADSEIARDGSPASGRVRHPGRGSRRSPAFHRSRAIAPITALSVHSAGRRDVQLHAASACGLFQTAAQTPIGGHAATHAQHAVTGDGARPAATCRPGSRPPLPESWRPGRPLAGRQLERHAEIEPPGRRSHSGPPFSGR